MYSPVYSVYTARYTTDHVHFNTVPAALLVIFHQEAWWLSVEAWWLSGSAPDCCPAVPGSNPASPQPTANCQFSGGLPPGMALGCGLTLVRGERGKNYEK